MRFYDASNPQPSRRPIARPGAIRGILFDANGVIYSRPRGNRRLNRFLAPLGLAALPDEQTNRVLYAERDAARTGRIGHEEYCRAKLRAYGLADPELIERGVALMADDSADIDLYPGTLDGLAGLKESDVRLAVVTDSTKPAALKLAWFASRGLPRDTFDAVVSSAEAGCCKPEPAIYAAALASLGLSPSEAAFVGHATDELEGAAAIGLKTIAFRPDDPEVEADVHVRYLTEILDLI